MVDGQDTLRRCEICDLPLSTCPHGLAEQRRHSGHTALVRISPLSMAHLDGCLHKNDDPIYDNWGEITTPGSWERLLRGEVVEATGGAVLHRPATHICADCREHDLGHRRPTAPHARTLGDPLVVHPVQ